MTVEPGIVFCQLAPWQFRDPGQNNLRRTYRRRSFLLSRLPGNLGARSSAPLLARFSQPAGETERRFPEGFYLDTREEWDDPHRFFRWRADSGWWRVEKWLAASRALEKPVHLPERNHLLLECVSQQFKHLVEHVGRINVTV